MNVKGLGVVAETRCLYLFALPVGATNKNERRGG